MTKESRWRRILWLEHLIWMLGAWTVLGVALAVIALGSGFANPLLRRVLIHRLGTLTGGQVEIRTVSVGWFSLNAVVHGLVIHGHEPPGTDPLFSVEELRVGLRVDSFWGRRLGLDEVILQQPRFHLQVDKNGQNNLLSFKQAKPSQTPFLETALDLRIHHIEIQDGWFLYNNLRRLVAMEGSNFRLNVQFGGTAAQPIYLGTLNWDSIQLARRRDFPLPANLSAKFTLAPEGLTIEQATVDAGRSHIDLQAETHELANPVWTYRYRAWLDLLDLREAYRTPEVPLGRIDLRGEGTIADGDILGKGSYVGDNITLEMVDFHSANLSSRSTYVLERNQVVLPDFAAYALGGSVKGRITMRYQGLMFRAETRVQDVRLSSVLPAIDHAGFPVDPLHWDAVISADTVETWHENFRDFQISARMHWDEPEELAAGHIPVTGDWQLRYRYEPDTLELAQGDFDTPGSQISITGTLAPKNSALDVSFQTESLATWDDFIHAISGDKPGTPEAQVPIDGSLQWTGKITGPSGGPEFQGHYRGESIRYDKFMLDTIDGDMIYSPRQLVISHGHTTRGTMRASLDGQLTLTDWTFLPENQWTGEIALEKVSLEGLEQLGGWSYPVQGLVTGQFHGRGTRTEPVLTGLVDLANGNVYGVAFNRLRGQLSVTPQEARLANAELRFFEPGTEKTGGAGIVTGSAAYRFSDQVLTTELVGASLPLANFGAIKSTKFPLGGQITFRVKSNGPILQPVADGWFRVVDLQVGHEVIGSFEGELRSDGKQAQLKLGSAMAKGAISGGATLGLASPMPLDGKVTIKNINLDPFLLAALHLKTFNGHSAADGDITVRGELQHPETLAVDARFDRLVLTYGNVQLENSGPVQLTSTRDSLKIISASLKGTDTNAELSGSVQFTGRRALSLKLNGSLDLRLISAYVPDVDVAGHADMNASFEGTLDRPRIVGRVQLTNASARSSGFPTGLSNVKGDLVFDANRLFFENLTAEAGGGSLILAGSVNYSEQPLRYDISAKTNQIRVRYPEGVSWLAGGSLRLSGTTEGGLLSGRVSVQRVNLTEGLESAAILAPSSGPSGTTSSSFLRNLQFDVEATSTPDSRMEWPGAHLEADADLRVRGTAEHPILLGHVHVISGDLLLRGNHYRVTRGDLNFANPFRLDPVLNVEAVTNIQQYEITLNFGGTASKMSLSYRSDPPLPGNDIITLLALGQTTSEASVRSSGTTQTGAASGASALLSEAISSQLGGRVERLFGITRFRVDPGLSGVGATGASQNAAARISVEQQVTRNLALTYISNVSSTQQQVIQVEYNVSRTISVVALRDINGTFGIDVKFKKRLP